MKSAQRLTGLFRTLPPVQTNGAEDAGWDTDAEPNADHIALAGMVRKAFREDPGFQGKCVSIEAFTDVVQLSGFVRSRPDMERALELAGGVSGVTSIRNCMQLY